MIKSIKLKLATNVARMEECRSAFKILTGKYTGRRPLERRRRKNGSTTLKFTLEKLCVNKKSWVDSTQDMNYWGEFVNAALNLRGP